MFLSDGEGTRDVTKQKRLKLARITSIFQSNQQVLVFGDVVFQLSELYKKCLHASFLRWDLPQDPVSDRTYFNQNLSLHACLHLYHGKYQNVLRNLRSALSNSDGLLQKGMHDSAVGALKLLNDLSSHVLRQVYRYRRYLTIGSSIYS